MDDKTTNSRQPEPGKVWVENKDTVYSLGQEEKNVVLLTVEEMALYPKVSFRNDTALESVHLPEGLTELPDSYFFGCSALTRVQLPYTLKRIGDYAFYGCTSLKELVLPDVLQDIGQFAFAGCSALTEENIPRSVTKIGTAAFRDCVSLRRVVFQHDAKVEELGSHCFQNCAGLQHCSLPAGVKTVPASLFYGCDGLKRFEVPASVATVQENAFYKSHLTEVVFRSAGTQLHPHALDGLEGAACSLWVGGRSLPITKREITETLCVGDLADDEPDPSEAEC